MKHVGKYEVGEDILTKGETLGPNLMTSETYSEGIKLDFTDKEQFKQFATNATLSPDKEYVLSFIVEDAKIDLFHGVQVGPHSPALDLRIINHNNAFTPKIESGVRNFLRVKVTSEHFSKGWKNLYFRIRNNGKATSCTIKQVMLQEVGGSFENIFERLTKLEAKL